MKTLFRTLSLLLVLGGCGKPTTVLVPEYKQPFMQYRGAWIVDDCGCKLSRFVIVEYHDPRLYISYLDDCTGKWSMPLTYPSEEKP